MKLLRMPEAHRLVMVSVLHDGASRWTLQWKGGFYVHSGTVESFAKLLMQIHAKDDKEDPRSFRSMKYLDIANEVTTGVDTTIYVWEADLARLAH